VHDRRPPGRVRHDISAQLPYHGVDEVEGFGVAGQRQRAFPADEHLLFGAV
jgi:hypothetical protein